MNALNTRSSQHTPKVAPSTLGISSDTQHQVFEIINRDPSMMVVDQVNKVYQDIISHLIEHGIEPSQSEQVALFNENGKEKLIASLQGSPRIKSLGIFSLRKVIIKYVIQKLPYIDQIKMTQVIGLKAGTYEGILLEIKRQKEKSLAHQKSMMNKKSYQDANDLYEALHPIERRLGHITSVIDGLKKHKDIMDSNKEIQAHLCTKVAEKNRDAIQQIFRKLKSDRENLSALEADKKIILKLEKEIVDAAKNSLSLYIQHMHTLYKDRFVRNEYERFRSLLNDVKNSEELEQFRVKFFERLVKLGIKKLKKKK